MIYFAVIGVCFFLNFFAIRQYKTFVFKLSFIVLFVFSALRYNYGSDYTSYHAYFDHVKAGVENLEIEEVGFYYINKIFPNYYLMVAVFSAIFLIFIYKIIVHYLEPDEYKYAILIFLIDPYLFLMSLSMMRQAIAIVLFAIAIHFAREKKYIYYLLICLCAMTIHTSAIVLLPFVFIANTKKDFLTKPKWVITILIILFVFSSTLVTPLVEWVLKAFNDSNYTYYYQTIQTNTLRATLLSSIPLIYICFNISKLEEDKLMYSKISVFAYFMDVFSYKYGMIGRFGYYFAFFKIIALPSIFVYNLRNSKGKDRIINVWIFPTVILLIYILRLYSFFTNPLWESFTDYRTILELI